MATVVVSAHFHTREEEFARAVEALLHEMGAKVDKIQNLHGTIAILGTDMSSKGMDGPTPSLPLPVPISPPEEIAVELPPVEPVEDTEMTVAIAPSDTIAMSTPPGEAPVVNAPSGEVVLKNLSSVCAVPFSVDPMLKASLLKVQGLAKVGDVLTFNYCSMSFKMPAEPPAGNPVRNTNPQYSDHSIRTMVDIVGKNADLIPVLLQLVDGPESCVVFGADLVDAISANSLEKNSDGSIPTQ